MTRISVWLLVSVLVQHVLFAQGTFKGEITTAGSYVFVSDSYPGADARAKITNALNALPATGGTIDARGLSGAQTFNNVDLTISKSVEILFGCGTYSMGTKGIIVTAAVPNVSLRGCVSFGGGENGADVSGTVFTYTGTTDAIAVGNTTADTHFVRIEDFKIDATGAGSAARGIALYRSYGGRLSGLRVRMAAGTQEGIRLDATAGASGWVVYNVLDNFIVSGGAYGIRLTGPTPGLANANRIIGGLVLGATTGISLENGDANTIFGTDFDTNTTGLAFGVDGDQNFVVGRFEGNTTDIAFDTDSTYNQVQYIGEDSIVVTGEIAGNFNTVFAPINGMSISSAGVMQMPSINLAVAGVGLTAADGVLTILGRGNGADENLVFDFDNAPANSVTLSSTTSLVSMIMSGLALDVETAGVRLSAADGVLTLLGLGNGVDESLTIDLDNQTANIIEIQSGTGTATLRFFDAVVLSSGGLVVGSTDSYYWSDTGDPAGTLDTALARVSAGIVSVTTGFNVSAAGVGFTGADGVLTLLGLGNGNDENLTFDFDNAAANEVNVATGTGVLVIDFGTLIIEGAYNSQDGSTGFTGTTCTSFKNGLCVAGT